MPRAASTTETPEARLRTLIATYDPAEQKLIRAVRTAIRKRVPTANEHVYDYSGSLVLSYTPTDHGKDGIFSTAMKPDGLRLYFGQGPRLPDPKKLLLGSGGTRYILVESASQLTHPDVKALIAAAIAKSPVPLAASGKGEMVDRSAGQQKRAAKKGSK